MPSLESPMQVTRLPSINELFPEHLMAHSSVISRRSPPTPPDAFTPRSHAHAHAHARASAASCSFDVLRPHPLTASLETVASSTNAALPPRVPGGHGGAYAFAVATEAEQLNAITKARPVFRVQLAPSSAPADGEYPGPPAGGGGGAPGYERPSYAANAYLSAPTTAGSAQSLQRMAAQQQQQQNQHQAQTQATVGVMSMTETAGDEKRHRCPHCHKRFNRPSSLNIHVNTHTGAKPFECRFPGCNRKFNVNSNMRRHYRNHLAARRRDVVARHMRPSTPPSPSQSQSRSQSQSHASPRGGYEHGLPPPSYASTSRSGSVSDQCSAYSESESDMDEREMDMHQQHAAHGVQRTDSAAARLRAQSSPTPHYPYPTSSSSTRSRSRAHSSATACSVVGCRGCVPISTALRPAFPESMGLPPRPRAERR